MSSSLENYIFPNSYDIGKLNGVNYSLINTSQIEQVSKLLLNSFFIEEPLGVALGLTIDQVTRWLPKHIESALEDGVSFVATVEEDEGGVKIVGVSINVICTTNKSAPSILNYLDKDLEPNMYQVARFLSILNQDLNISELVPEDANMIDSNASTFMCLFLNVDKNYAGRGIGKTLAHKSELLAQEKGIYLLQVDTTSEYSYRVYTSLGYRAVRSMPFEQFRDEDGTKLINEDALGVHQFGRVLIKILTPISNHDEDKETN